MKKILLVEDEDVILKALCRLLERNHYEVNTATTVEQALAAEPQSFDLILADLRLPGAEGTTIIPAAGAVPVVIMTSHASVRSAVEAMRHGAIDYIAKPFDHEELLMVIERALMQNLLKAQNHALKLELQRNRAEQIGNDNPYLDCLLNENRQLKHAQEFLHLYGERGTDREALARALHATGARRDAPFVVSDIGRDPAINDLSNSSAELPSKSAVAGPSPGSLLQAAQNGSLILRHPERLTTTVQQKLGGIFSQGTLMNLESGRQRKINVRLITISHESIDDLLAKGLLVEELGELLIRNQFEVPPLRQRPEDIAPLAQAHLSFLEKRHGLGKMQLTPEALAVLQSNDWPGNAAELRLVIARAAYLCRGSSLTPADLGTRAGTLSGSDQIGARDLNLDEYFRYFVRRNQRELSETELAARLGISRKALWERRQKMNLPRHVSDALSNTDAPAQEP